MLSNKEYLYFQQDTSYNIVAMRASVRLQDVRGELQDHGGATNGGLSCVLQRLLCSSLHQFTELLGALRGQTNSSDAVLYSSVYNNDQSFVLLYPTDAIRHSVDCKYRIFLFGWKKFKLSNCCHANLMFRKIRFDIK